jgi:hypothetical protein
VNVRPKNRRTTAGVNKTGGEVLLTQINFKTNTMTNTIDDRIEAKLISKIAHYRLSLRTQFRNRHNVAWPELTYKTIIGDINNLKVWLRIAERIDETKTPYATYMAKQLTK